VHLVFGGELTDLDHVQFRSLDQLDIVGVYPNYATAYAAWKSKAQQTVDNAHMRYSSCICTVCSIPKRISAPSADTPVAAFQCPGETSRSLAPVPDDGWDRGGRIPSSGMEDHRFVVEPEGIYEQFERDAPVIIAMWHGQHFLIPFIRRAEDRAKVLVSRHRDGEINALAAERSGRCHSGLWSSRRRLIGKGGVSAFKEMLGALHEATTSRSPRIFPRSRAPPGSASSSCERFRPAIYPDRDRDQTARGTHELGPHGDQSSVRPWRRRSPANRCACLRMLMAPRSKPRGTRSSVARRGHRSRLCHRRIGSERRKSWLSACRSRCTPIGC